MLAFGYAKVVVLAIVAGKIAADETSCSIKDFNYLYLNSTNQDSLLPCLQYGYKCFSDGVFVYKQDDANNGRPPSDCNRISWTVTTEKSASGPLTIPSLVSIHEVRLAGSSCDRQIEPNCTTPPERLNNVTDIDLPDLVTADSIYIERLHMLQSVKVPKLVHLGRINMYLYEPSPPISLAFPSLNDTLGIQLEGNIDAVDLPVLNSANYIEIHSTGNLDCTALVASVFNATKSGSRSSPTKNDSIICNSKKASITTGHPMPTATGEGGRLALGRTLIVLGFLGSLGFVV